VIANKRMTQSWMSRRSVLRCVAVCCSVLQRVAVCDAVCCSVSSRMSRLCHSRVCLSGLTTVSSSQSCLPVGPDDCVIRHSRVCLSDTFVFACRAFRSVCAWQCVLQCVMQCVAAYRGVLQRVAACCVAACCVGPSAVCVRCSACCRV